MTAASPVSPANLDDASAIAAIYGHYVKQGTATFETEPPSVEEMAERMRKVLDGGYPWLAARDEAGEVLGTPMPAVSTHARAIVMLARSASMFSRTATAGGSVRR